MKEILVLSSRSGDADLIARILENRANVSYAPDLATARAMHVRAPFDMILADLFLLDTHPDTDMFRFSNHPFVAANPFVQFVVLCEKDQMKAALEAVKQGAAGYLPTPVRKQDVQLLFQSVNQALSRDFELDYLRDHFWKTEWLEMIQSRNPRMKKVYENIRSVAPTIATVLLLGDTGTGKGMTARLIHWHSQRYDKPFIEVHCGAIPDTLMESELFGHEKGAFTGADRRKPGKFEMALGGTIFLDEIGTITPSAQIKLLQVLQDGIYSRVGGDAVLKSDVRIIAATNSDITELVKNAQFRKDLYYRLNVFPIDIPPLQERLEDLPGLTDVFLKKLNFKYGKKITSVHPMVMDRFKRYDWPGNIRELENLLERAYILETGPVLMPHRFPLETMPDMDGPETETDSGTPISRARQHAIDRFELEYLTTLLGQTRGRIDQAAAIAGITPRQLNRLLKRHRLSKNAFKPGKDT